MNIRPGTLYGLLILLFFNPLCSLAGLNNDFIKEELKSLSSNGFIENKGQFISEESNSSSFILFKSSSPGLDIYITKKGLSYFFYKKINNPATTDAVDHLNSSTQYSAAYEWSRFDMNIEKSTIKKENIKVSGSNQTEYNYYLSQCPDGITGIKKYKKVIIENIYKNVDWVLYYTTDGQMKYDFVVKPGGNVKDILISYTGVIDEFTKENNSINISNSFGEVKEGNLYTYEMGTEKQINSRYFISEREGPIKKISFDVENYDHSKTLIIDPPLTWATYYGAAGDDYAYCIKTDNGGNIYVAGLTQSLAFPLLNLTGAYFNNSMNGNGTYGGFSDAFILKFNSAGILQWATFYGGNSGDGCTGMDVDMTGNIYISGLTYSNNFPIQPMAAAYNRISKGGTDYDIFILKFNSSGARQWSTYFGGNGNDDCYRIKRDPQGNIFLTGTTASSNFTTTSLTGAYNQSSPGGGPNDGFISKFNVNGGLVWSTYLGGNSNDIFNGITFDSYGNIYLGGNTYSANFTTVNPGTGFFDGVIGGTMDAVIVKFNSSGAITWSTFYGGAVGAFDIIYDLTTDLSNNLYIIGLTATSDFPVVSAGNCSYNKSFDGIGDAFISEFDVNRNLVWSTYFGGSSLESPINIVCDAYNNIIINGRTSSSDFPIQTPLGSYSQPAYGGGTEDGFITMFNAWHSLYWSTYIGGNDIDYTPFNSLALNNSGEILTFFNTESATQTTQSWGSAHYVTSNAGDNDFFLAKFVPNIATQNTLSVTTGSTNVLCNGDSNGTAFITPTSGTPTYTYAWTGTSHTTQSISGLAAGSYIVSVIDANCLVATQQITITQPLPLVASSVGSQSVCVGQSATFSANITGGTIPYNYTWNGSSGTNSQFTINPGSDTIFTLAISDANGCTVITQSISIAVLPQPTANAGTDTSICYGTTITLSASGGGSYSWNATTGLSNTGIHNPSFTPVATTTCVVTVSNGACEDSDEVIITVNSSPVILTSGNTTITIGNSTNISASGGGTYSWSPSSGLNCTSCHNPIATPTQTTTYYILVTNSNGCTSLDSVVVTVDLLCGEIFVPNAFSPNADGQNDVLAILGPCLTKGSFIIFDRWGNKVFESDNLNYTWDGVYRGRLLDPGVFVYTLTATLVTGEEIIKKGNISLVR